MPTKIGDVTVAHPALDQETVARETMVDDACKKFCDWLMREGLLWCFYPPESNLLRPVPYSWFHRVDVEHRGPGGSQKVGEFLDACLNGEGWAICLPVKDEDWDFTTYEIQRGGMRYWLCRYYGIDQLQADREREALYQAVRQQARDTRGQRSAATPRHLEGDDDGHD